MDQYNSFIWVWQSNRLKGVFTVCTRMLVLYHVYPTWSWPDYYCTSSCKCWANMCDCISTQSACSIYRSWLSNCWTTGPCTVPMRLLISFSGTVPAQAIGWCGAASPADSPEALQARQVLCHLPRKRRGWRSHSEGWWSCTKGAWCKFCCGSQKDQDQVQDIHWVVG